MSKPAKPLDVLIEALEGSKSHAQPSVRLVAEPKIKGEPFPDLVTHDETDTRPALYIYDKTVLDTLLMTKVLRNPKDSPPIEGVDANGRPCTKAYIHGEVYKAYQAIPHELPPIAMDMLGIPVDTSMRLAIADAPSTAESGYEKYLLVKVMGNTPEHGIKSLIKSGLLHEDYAKDRSRPHSIEFSKESGDPYCTIALPISTAIAACILRAKDRNRCEDWTTPDTKSKLGIEEGDDVDDLIQMAAQELNDLHDPAPQKPHSSLARSASPKERGNGTAPPSTAAQVAVLAATLPPLSVFGDELKNAGLVQTMQILASGQTQIIIGTAKRETLERLSTGNINRPVTSEPLGIGNIRIEDKTKYPLTYYTITASDFSRLQQAVNQEIPHTEPLPPRIKRDPFRVGYSGDFATRVALTDVVLHHGLHEGRVVHSLYIISNSPRRIDAIAGDMGFPTEQRTWLTSKEESPSIMRLEVSPQVFEALKKEPIGAFKHTKVGQKTRYPTVFDASTARTSLEGGFKEKYKVEDKAAAAQKPTKPEGRKKPEPLSTEAGEPLLFSALEEALAKKRVKKVEGIGSNEPVEVPNYSMALAKVHHKNTRTGETWVTRKIYVRGTNDDLRKLGSNIKQQGWLGEDQIAYEVGRKGDAQLAGLMTITLPDTSWKNAGKHFPLMPQITPDQLGLKTETPPGTDTFTDAKQARGGMVSYFDSLQRYGKYVSPEELALQHLRGKQIRMITISEPDEGTLKLLDAQIAKIETSLTLLRATAERIKDHGTLLAFADGSSSGNKGKTQKRKTRARNLEDVKDHIDQAEVSVKRALRDQERLVKSLKDDVANLKQEQDAIHEKGLHQEIAILDADDETALLLSNAKELTASGRVERVGKSLLRFEPDKSFAEQLRARGIQTPKLRATPVPVGEVNQAIERARARYLKEESAKETDGADDIPHTPAIHKPRIKLPPKSARRLCEDVQPILCYEKILLPDGKDSGETQPVLILPLENPKMATAASRLCTVLETTGWLAPPTFYVLSHAPDGKAAATPPPPSPASRSEATLDADMMSHLSGIIADLKYHTAQSSSFSCNATVELLESLRNLARNGLPREEGAPAEPTSLSQKRTIRAVSDALKTSGLDSLLNITSVDEQATQDLKSALKPFEDAIKVLSKKPHSAEDKMTAAAPAMHAKRGKPFPYTLPASAATDDGIYPEILGRHQAELVRIEGEAPAVPAVKLYITQDAAESFIAHGKQSGVDVTHADRSIKPQAMEGFVFHALAGRTQPKITGRGG